ncbi:hypothetical protein V6Z11_A05G003200 [Gossypium hirsutum]
MVMTTIRYSPYEVYQLMFKKTLLEYKKYPYTIVISVMHLFSTLEDFPSIKQPSTVTRRNSTKFLPPSPFLTRFQCDRFLNSSSLNTQHMLVFIISKISQSLCLFIPGIPYHYMQKK